MIKQINPFRVRSGFTLVEMAIVLAIVALLLGGLLPTLSAQLDQQRAKETQATVAEIREALIGFAIANGHLPCPAKSAIDGAENRGPGGVCSTRQGFIPWVTLGVPRADSWSRLFHYSVTFAYSNSTARFDLNTARDITIRTRNTGGGFDNVSNADDIPAVVLSHGKNGYGATLYSGVAFGGVSATNVDEQKNVTGDGTGKTYIFREQSNNTSTSGGEFDDLVVWLSPNILFNRMVAAGRLP